jgi:hypothetical protein
MSSKIDSQNSFPSKADNLLERVKYFIQSAVKTADKTDAPPHGYLPAMQNAVGALATLLLMSLVAAATITTSFAYGTVVSWSGTWQAVPETTYKNFWPAFLTDSGCSVAAPDPSFTLSSSTPLCIVAKRTFDHTVWINSTSDLSQAVWVGWQPVPAVWTDGNPVPGKGQTSYPPSASYYYDYGSNTYNLAVVAVGISGGADDSVYLNIFNLKTSKWTGWKSLPGLSTDSGATVTDRRVYARRTTIFGAASVYENDFSASSPISLSGWSQVPGSFSTKVQVCAYTSGSLPALLGARYQDGQVCLNAMISPDMGYYYWSGWLPICQPATTDAKPAGPLGPYSGFFKGVGDHQVHGLLGTSSNSPTELIPGNKLTDAGLDSCSVFYSSAGQKTMYKNLLFAKGMGEQQIYFTLFHLFL